MDVTRIQTHLKSSRFKLSNIKAILIIFTCQCDECGRNKDPNTLKLHIFHHYLHHWQDKVLNIYFGNRFHLILIDLSIFLIISSFDFDRSIQVPPMTKKDTMCDQCTPPKRIVGANPEVSSFSKRYKQLF